jgi:hypothetical protein
MLVVQMAGIMVVLKAEKKELSMVDKLVCLSAA